MAVLGPILRGFRKRRGLSLEALAELSGVSVRALSALELGQTTRPRLGTLAALSQALDLPTDEHDSLVAIVVSEPRPEDLSIGEDERVHLLRSIGEFVGRQDELGWLATAAVGGTGSPDIRACAITGAPGSGKTTLAVHFAHESAHLFPAGQVLVDLRGVDERPAPVEEIALAVLTGLGEPEGDLAGLDLGMRLARIHELLRERSTLIVLDNAAGPEQVLPFIPPAPGGTTGLLVVTSRFSFQGVPGVMACPLDVLSPDEAAAFVAEVVGWDRVEAEPEAAAAIARSCGYLPLALRVAANWASTHSGWKLERLAERLRDEQRRLHRLAAGDLSVQAAFMLSYQRLSARTSRVFRLLSVVPGEDFAAPQVAVLTGLSLVQAEACLSELADWGLLTPGEDQRFRIHDLLRLFARACSAREDTDSVRDQAVQGMRDWLLDTVVVAGRWFEPDYGKPGPDPDRLVALDTLEQARTWLRRESGHWLPAYLGLSERGGQRRIIEVAEAMHWFSDTWSSWPHWVAVFRTAADSAQDIGDTRWEAVHRNYLSWALDTCEKSPTAAVAEAQAALRLAKAADDLPQQAWAHFYLGAAYDALSQWDRALDAGRASVELFEQAQDAIGSLQAHHQMLGALRELGRIDEGLTILSHVRRSLDDPARTASIPPDILELSRGNVLIQTSAFQALMGQWEEAVLTHQALEGHFAGLGFFGGEAFGLLGWARALEHLGRFEEAAQRYREVLSHEKHSPPRTQAQAREGLARVAG